MPLTVEQVKYTEYLIMVNRLNAIIVSCQALSASITGGTPAVAGDVDAITNALLAVGAP